MSMIEVVFSVNPQNLPGLNRLASQLNRMRSSGFISDWHLGRWSDNTKTKHGILFDSEEDAMAAKAQVDLSTRSSVAQRSPRSKADGRGAQAS